MASELQVVTLGEVDPASAVAMLDHLETRWSRFLPDSDITRLNLAGGAEVEVDAGTVVLVDAMVHAWRCTGGAFDPTLLPPLVDAGYRTSIDDPRLVTLLPDGRLVCSGPTGPSVGDIVSDARRSTVTLPAGLTLDAGGVGKGLAADLAVRHLLDLGATGALVSIGGDVAAGGEPPHRADGEPGWEVVVAHPDPSAPAVGTLVVSRGGVATSSTWSRRWRHGGGEHHHLVDPATGHESTTDLASVTVIARSGWLAEAHATAALLAGSAGATEYLERHALDGVAVHADGSVHPTDDLWALTGAGRP
jgi:thiamine biosynthesis lipoprotein